MFLVGLSRVFLLVAGGGETGDVSSATFADDEFLKLGLRYAEAGRFDEALEILNEAVEENPTARRFMALGVVYLQKNDYLRAYNNLSEALSREPPATESGSDVAWWGPLILGLAGAAAGAGGGWALADAADRRDLAARAATAAEHDGRADEAALLETTGWTLVGVGAAALAGAAVWLAVELAGGGESPADAGRAPHLVPAGPGLAGFGVAF